MNERNDTCSQKLCVREDFYLFPMLPKDSGGGSAVCSVQKSADEKLEADKNNTNRKKEKHRIFIVIQQTDRYRLLNVIKLGF